MKFISNVDNLDISRMSKLVNTTNKFHIPKHPSIVMFQYYIKGLLYCPTKIEQ